MWLKCVYLKNLQNYLKKHYHVWSIMQIVNPLFQCFVLWCTHQLLFKIIPTGLQNFTLKQIQAIFQYFFSNYLNTICFTNFGINTNFSITVLDLLKSLSYKSLGLLNYLFLSFDTIFGCVRIICGQMMLLNDIQWEQYKIFL